MAIRPSVQVEGSLEKPRFLKTEAIVLKHYPLGEADRLLTLYTPLVGKVRAVARGVRKIKSRLAGHLEPLTRSQVVITRGKSLDIITSAETIKSNLPLRQDLWRMTCGQYLAELVERFSREGLANAALYRLLADGLEWLARAPETEGPLRYLEVRLLILAGYRPELFHCVECGADIMPEAHAFSAQAGGVLCPRCRHRDAACRPLSLNALKVLRLFAASAPETAWRVRLPAELAVELEHLMRHYMRHILEQDLKSVEFLDMLRQEREAVAAPRQPSP